MANSEKLTRSARTFLVVVVSLGFSLLFYCTYYLFGGSAPASFSPVQFLWLTVLTLGSGLIPVKIFNVQANISIAEPFIFCGTLLFGPEAGAVLVFIDVALIWINIAFRKGVVWHRCLFSLANNPLGIFIAGCVFFWISGTGPLAGVKLSPPGIRFVVAVTVFSVLYFLLTSFNLALVFYFQKRKNPFLYWYQHFSQLSIQYWAAASVAGLLVSITRGFSIAAFALGAPLLLFLFLTYRWSSERVEKAEKYLADMKKTFLQTIEALALAIDAKDQVTHGHIRRVQRYTMAVAEALGLNDPKQLDALRAAALLHDTGKLAVPEYILNKPGPLTASEFERMKLHASVGADILKSIDFPYPVEPLVRHHHENWDGTGYPAGLKGHDIPLGARILSVVDCYDALTSDRPYRPRFSREHAEKVLRDRSGVMYDPWVVEKFLSLLDTLERLDSIDTIEGAHGSDTAGLGKEQLEVINATTAEDREFNELRRELPKAADGVEAARVLFSHLRRVIPAQTFVLYVPHQAANEIVPCLAEGVGVPAIEALRIAIGDRISGWAAAHKQVVMNSNATLELGPVARTMSVPLRYSLAVPLTNGPSGSILGVVTAYGSDPFTNDHRRMLESAAILFVSAVPQDAIALPALRRHDDRKDQSRIH